MRKILGFICALAVLFAADYLLKNPYWFNEPRHFSGGFLVVCLMGAILQRFAIKTFVIYGQWFALIVLIPIAALAGDVVEILEYHFIIPALIVAGLVNPLELHPDTIMDLQMNSLGGLVGAILYLWIFDPGGEDRE